MESTTFYYSKSTVWIFTAMFIIVIVVFSGLIAGGPDVPNQVITGVFDLLVIILFCIFCRKYVIPVVKGKPAIVLDREKVQYFDDDKTVYWRDVERVALWNSSRMTYVRLTTKGVADDVKIATRFIQGTDEEILAAVQHYFKEGELS
jgi:hypothetical protein